jgi:glycosyltransferase involved in cell wall biosynthesis
LAIDGLNGLLHYSAEQNHGSACAERRILERIFVKIGSACHRATQTIEFRLLKVLHVSFTFSPNPIGGTEVYVESLAQELQAHGIESIIVAPSSKGVDERYSHNGLSVRRYRSARNSKNLLRELYGAGDPESGSAFAQILDEERPDIVHLHAFTREVSTLLVHHAKRRGISTFFTYHTPTVSCQRGTLIWQNKEICDGVIEVHRCAECSLMNEGLWRGISMPLSYVPLACARMLKRFNLSGGVWTALRMTDLIKTRRDAFDTLMSDVDCVIALREWVQTLLLRNGVPTSKIKLVPHGLAGTEKKPSSSANLLERPLRVAFLGRADKVKGIDTLIKAIRMMPSLDVDLHLYGLTQGSGDQDYWTMLRALAANDPRIQFLQAVPHDQVIALLATYHVLAVPSRWMETGPLVVLEAFAAGTPVCGSNLGGIAEWVIHERNGLLVDLDDVQGWVNAIKRCAEDRELLKKLRQGIAQPRTMTDVAKEMARVYRDRCNEAS